jgi:hypothetical protein
MSSDIMQKVHLRQDVIDVMTWQLACGASDGCTSDEFRSASYYAGINCLVDERFTNVAYCQLVKNTLADTVTLGLYSTITEK